MAPAVRSQSSVTTGNEEPPGDRSFYLGRPVKHPEDLSGVWETSDGQGGAIGIHLNLLARVSDDADPPAWAPQWQNLNFAVFERKGPEIVFGDENYFGDNERGGRVTLENGHLQLHFVSTVDRDPSVDVDLAYQQDACWHGRFHRGSFDATVSLCRPTPGAEVRQSPIVGTWSQQSGLGSSCIHIAQARATTFTGWTDSLEMPGHTIYTLNDREHHSLLQSFGDLAKVNLTSDGLVSLELGVFNPMCCPHPFSGHLSADGTTIEGNFPPGLNQSLHAGTFTKMPGNTCVDVAKLPKTRPKACVPETRQSAK
ncbi:MAG: hypothetical protein ABSG51_08515 [Terracidiphilus sp.]|jgi:hypothetical protein